MCQNGWCSLVLLAGGEPGGGGLGFFSIFTLWIPILVVFYLLLILPQRRERSRREAMLRALKKNDRVITVGGIHGVVTNVHQDAGEVTIKVDEATNTKLRITLSSIARVVSEEGSKDSSAKAKK